MRHTKHVTKAVAALGAILASGCLELPRFPSVDGVTADVVTAADADADAVSADTTAEDASPDTVETVTPGWSIRQLGTNELVVCLVTDDDEVWCWGHNRDAHLLSPASDTLHTPTRLTLPPIDELFMGSGRHICARTHETPARLLCWGANLTGQAGGAPIGALVHEPITVPLDADQVVDIAIGGSSTCAVSKDATVACWGLRLNGQRFDGTDVTASPEPIPGVTGDEGYVGVCAGSAHGCVWSEREVRCFGEYYDAEPVDIALPEARVQSVTCGNSFSCARVADDGGEDRLFCWGWNLVGQVGLAPADAHYGPNELAPDFFDGGVDAVIASWRHACVVDGSRQVRCWGLSNQGVTGRPVNTASPLPFPVDGASDAALFHTSVHTGCVVTAEEGEVRCWGSNAFGMLGTGEADALPHLEAVRIALPPR